MDINIYTPLTEEAYTELYRIAYPIIQTGGFPSGNSPDQVHARNVIWNNYKVLTGDNSTQPGCGSCPGVQKYWIQAMNVIDEYIFRIEKEKEGLSTANEKNIE